MAQTIKPATWGKRAKSNYTPVVLLALGVAIALWLMSTIQPAPVGACYQVNGYMPDGAPTSFTQCN